MGAATAGGETARCRAACLGRAAVFERQRAVVGTGAEVKDFLASEPVLVNGEPETRRGRQLSHGDVVSAGGRELRVSG